jgi:hypothetical protein
LVEDGINFSGSLPEFSTDAEFNDVCHEVWMGLVAHFEDIISVYNFEACIGGLQIIQSVSHIPVSSKDESFEPILGNSDRLLSHDNLKPFQDFFISKFSEPDNGTSRLNWFNQFGGVIASDCEPSRA